MAVQNPEAKDKKNGPIKYASTCLSLRSPETSRESIPLMAQALTLTYRLLVTDKLILKFRLRFKLLEPVVCWGS